MVTQVGLTLQRCTWILCPISEHSTVYELWLWLSAIGASNQLAAAANNTASSSVAIVVIGIRLWSLLLLANALFNGCIVVIQSNHYHNDNIIHLYTLHNRSTSDPTNPPTTTTPQSLQSFPWLDMVSHLPITVALISNWLEKVILVSLTLECHTDDTTCCRGIDNPNGGSRGEWYTILMAL